MTESAMDRTIILGLRPEHANQDKAYSLTQHELAMGGIQAVSQWVQTIEHDLVSMSREVRRNMMAPPPREPRDLEQMLRFAGQIAPDHVNWEAMWNELAREMGFDRQRRSPESEAKARKLFGLAAGEKAAGILERGAGLPLTGSSGGRYTLHKRATYCVTRDSDQVRFCAVVPGVPLWDHLLGIKLMIEHDEPRFLQTANKAGGPNWLDNDRPMDFRPGAINYAEHANGYLTATEIILRRRELERRFLEVNPPIVFDSNLRGPSRY